MGQIKEVIGPDLCLITMADVWRADWRVPSLWARCQFKSMFK